MSRKPAKTKLFSGGHRVPSHVSVDDDRQQQRGCSATYYYCLFVADTRQYCVTAQGISRVMLGENDVSMASFYYFMWLGNVSDFDDFMARVDLYYIVAQ
jgi:hypothetical protein